MSLIALFKRRNYVRVTFVILAVLPFAYLIVTHLDVSIMYRKHDRNCVGCPIQMSNKGVNEETEKIDENEPQNCMHPKLQLWHPVMKPYFAKPTPLKCHEADPNWVYSENGNFKISKKAAKKHGGSIDCKLVPILRGDNDFRVTRAEAQIFTDGKTLVSDVYEAQCLAADGENITMVLLGVAPKPEVRKRPKSLPKSALDLDILMFGFDSVSRLTWIRLLPKTYKYFVEELGGVVMEGYNIVGDGTPQALLPILTGKTEVELPEARRGWSEAKPVDNHTWIWKDLEKLGYATQWGEDSSSFGTFTLRMLGFKDPPVDHYMRPFYFEAEKHYRKFIRFCLGNVPRHLNMMNYMKEFCDVYSSQRKFSFLFHAEYTHGGYSELNLADDDLLAHLKYLKEKGHLDHAMLILMADHGARFHKLRTTEQGKYEERLPFVGVRLPEKFLASHPKVAKNLKINGHRLTTPFDIHATFKDIIDFSGDKSYVGEDPQKALPRGISLFKEIPKRRSCNDAGIELHWCGCLAWTVIQVTDPMVIKATLEVVNTINEATYSERSNCKELELGKVTEAVRYSSNDQLLKFSRSAGGHGRIATLTDKMNTTEELYQVTFTTEPGAGSFEATIRHSISSGTLSVELSAISRINKYGKHPHCIAEKLPHLRAYCYCEVQLKSENNVEDEHDAVKKPKKKVVKEPETVSTEITKVFTQEAKEAQLNFVTLLKV